MHYIELYFPTGYISRKGLYMYFSRHDYMTLKCTYKEYYGQFSDVCIELIDSIHTQAKWYDLLREDELLNNVPLSSWEQWSLIVKRDLDVVNKRIGNSGSCTLSECVCALKEAVRVYVSMT